MLTPFPPLCAPQGKPASVQRLAELHFKASLALQFLNRVPDAVKHTKVRKPDKKSFSPQEKTRISSECTHQIVIKSMTIDDVQIRAAAAALESRGRRCCLHQTSNRGAPTVAKTVAAGPGH